MRKIKALILFILISICVLTGCEKREIVLTTAFRSDELLRIDSKSAFLPEYMLYLTNMQNEYEAVYGSEIWSRVADGESLENRLKDMALAKLAQVKVLNLMAEEYGLLLTEKEEGSVKDRAEKYFGSLNETEKSLMGVSLETVEGAYRELLLSEKVHEYLIRDINPEISDDEARIVTIWHILIRTYAVDSEGNRTPYSERGMKEAYETAKAALDEILTGEESFESVAAKYSEDPELSYTFGRGEMPKEVEDVAFSLDKDQVSDIIETDSGYHIFKCVSDFDVEMTQQNKETILKEERQKAFDETYEAFLPGRLKTINQKLYDSVRLITDERVGTRSFFE